MTPLVQTPFLAQSFVFTSKTPPAHPPRRTSIIYTTSNDFRKLVHAKSQTISFCVIFVSIHHLLKTEAVSLQSNF